MITCRYGGACKFPAEENWGTIQNFLCQNQNCSLERKRQYFPQGMECKGTEDCSERKSIVYLQAQCSVVRISKKFKKNVTNRVVTEKASLKEFMLLT